MKTDLIENLGNVRLPKSLKMLLDERCSTRNLTKSEIVRTALCSFFNVDVSVVVDHMLLTQKENNGHDGERESIRERESVELATKLKKVIMA